MTKRINMNNIPVSDSHYNFEKSLVNRNDFNARKSQCCLLTHKRTLVQMHNLASLDSYFEMLKSIICTLSITDTILTFLLLFCFNIRTAVSCQTYYLLYPNYSVCYFCWYWCKWLIFWKLNFFLFFFLIKRYLCTKKVNVCDLCSSSFLEMDCGRWLIW